MGISTLPINLIKIFYLMDNMTSKELIKEKNYLIKMIRLLFKILLNNNRKMNLMSLVILIHLGILINQVWINNNLNNQAY